MTGANCYIILAKNNLFKKWFGRLKTAEIRYVVAHKKQMFDYSLLQGRI
jgi:hypothetical protein